MAKSTPKRQEQAAGKRAAIYSRVSDKSQDGEDKTSISEQTNDMETYCESKGLTITARYQEVGRGWSKKRPEFQRMLADAKQGRFDTIVCWKSDRLSRGMYPAAAVMEVVEAHQIGLEAVMDTIDMKTFGLMAAIGKIELDNFRERASMGKRGAARQGRIPTSQVPYGYCIDGNGAPGVDEACAEVVRRIFRQYVHEGMGGPAIARQLMAEGVPAGRSTARWHDTQINRILRNETYKGTWWYGKARHVSTEDGTRVYPQSRDSWIGIRFPQLVDEETWDQAQYQRDRRRSRSKRNTKVFHLLQHLVRCSECGMLMGCIATRRRTTKYKGKTYKYELDPPRRYYKCYGMLRHRLGCREHSMIRAERLENLVWEEVRKVLEEPSVIVAGIQSLGNGEDATAGEELARAERELSNVRMEEDRAIRLYVSGKITERQLDLQRKFITERLESLREKVKDCRARESAQAGRRELAERVMEWAERMGTGLDDLPQEERREVLLLLLDEATIDRENKVSLSLAIPEGDLESIEQHVPRSVANRPGKMSVYEGTNIEPEGTGKATGIEQRAGHRLPMDQAAEPMGVTERHAWRILAAYRKE